MTINITLPEASSKFLELIQQRLNPQIQNFISKQSKTVN